MLQNQVLSNFIKVKITSKFVHPGNIFHEWLMIRGERVSE